MGAGEAARRAGRAFLGAAEATRLGATTELPPRIESGEDGRKQACEQIARLRTARSEWAGNEAHARWGRLALARGSHFRLSQV